MTPRPRIEGKRPDRFRPPHCPWPECYAHLVRGRSYRAIRHGSFYRACDPHRRVPRFKCPTCHRTFSRQTFATSYYMKRPDLLHRVAGMLVAGCGLRAIARELECAHGTVGGQCRRLAQHALVFHELSLTHIDELNEPIVLDHFETFVRSQVERVGVATVVGKDSWFVFALDGVRYRGAMRRSRRKQALKRTIETPPSGEVVRSTRETLQKVLALTERPLRLISDDHVAYAPAIRGLEADGARIQREIHRNPLRGHGDPEGKARARDAAMFPIDLLHKLIRHLQQHHSRETIAFGRTTADTVGRLAIFAVWRNFIKKLTERRPCNDSPATQLGIADKRWKWTEVLAERLFPARIAATR